LDHLLTAAPCRGGAERVCAATGDTAHWLAAVDVNDSLIAFRSSDYRIYRAALDAGFTPQQWRTVKRGNPESRSETTAASGS